MLLTRNRIWGNVVGGKARSGTLLSIYLLGYKELKKSIDGPARAEYYRGADLRHIFPFVADWEKLNSKKFKF